MENRLPTIKESLNEFHQRYNVSKANGTPVDLNAIYFVLRIDECGGDIFHVIACREALRTYISVLRSNNIKHLRKLTDDLYEYLESTEEEFQCRCISGKT